MPDEIQPTDADPAAVLAGIFIDQALALDRVFKRAFVESLRKGARHPHRDIRRALKAQAQCHRTFKILIALKAAAARQANDSARSSKRRDAAKKFSLLNKATIETAKAPS